MKKYTYEFEIYPSEEIKGYWLVEPHGLLGATEGYTKADAIDMAVDWLQVKVEDWIEQKKEIPIPIFGSELKHKNAERLIVSVSR